MAAGRHNSLQQGGSSIFLISETPRLVNVAFLSQAQLHSWVSVPLEDVGADQGEISYKLILVHEGGRKYVLSAFMAIRRDINSLGDTGCVFIQRSFIQGVYNVSIYNVMFDLVISFIFTAAKGSKTQVSGRGF